MDQLVVYNSLSRQQEPFKALNPPFVGMYVCGPTVYGPPHLGHARSAITFDIIYRYLTFLGFRVRYVRNITDVGHLVNDADAGESKIEKQARLEQLEPMEVAQRYYNAYIRDMNALNLIRPSIEPRATGHITEQIEAVEKIMANGFAYESNGSVYFDVAKYAEKFPYGKLSGRDLDHIMSESRDNLTGQSEKKNSFDFAIWKKAEPNHIMRWNSPWGPGFPGWHLECTVMSTKYLGTKYDIHGGGMDLLFPHHEAEIAQSNACNPDACDHMHDEATYWLHNNMITYEGKKMGKSLGNAINLQGFFQGEHWAPVSKVGEVKAWQTVMPKRHKGDETPVDSVNLLQKAYSPMVIRFFMLGAHYRSTLDFSNEALQASEKAFHRMGDTLKRLDGIQHAGKPVVVNEEFEQNLQKFMADVKSHMNEDFNTAKVLARMFDTLTVVNQLYKSTSPSFAVQPATFDQFKIDFRTVFTDWLGLKSEETEHASGNDTLDGLMSLVIELRAQARQEKNWGIADQIRDQLTALSIKLEDTPNGTDWYHDKG